MGRRLTYASFFSGVGGFENAYDAAGFERVFSCEIDRIVLMLWSSKMSGDSVTRNRTGLESLMDPCTR